MPSSDRVFKGTPGSPPAPTEAVRTRVGAGRLVGTEGGAARQAGSLGGPATRSTLRPDGDANPELTAELSRAIREAERRGYESGRARAETEFAGLIAVAGTFATLLEDAAPRQAPVVAALVAELAVAVANRILDAEVSLAPGLLCGALERAMEGVNGSPEARVLLHPSAVGPVRDAWISEHGTAFAGKRWSFEGDPTLPIGGCVVRHDHGFVDAGLEAQLAEVAAAMDKVIPLIGRPFEVAA